MGSLREGEADMHYSDGSHRWLAPVHGNPERWAKKVREHIQEHLATMGGDVLVPPSDHHLKGW